jgi:hypothetical protein
MALFSRRKLRLPKLGNPAPDRVHAHVVPWFWGYRDAQAVADGVSAINAQVEPGFHFADNLLTWGRNNSMLDDEAFVAAWRNNVESKSDEGIVWRRYILACAGYHCVQLDGDFVECGAYTGVGIKTVVDYLGGTEFPKTFWGYDLFEHAPHMAHHAMPEHGPDLEARVRAKFTDYPQVRVVRGSIPEVFSGHSPSRIAYLHIDLNEAPAEVASLEALFDRVVAAGLVILDDYDCAAYRSQKIAEDAWFDARGYRVFPLPTGQGIVIKR